MVFVKSREVYAFSRNASRVEKEEPLLVVKPHFVSLRLCCAPLRATPRRLPLARDPILSEGLWPEAVARIEASAMTQGFRMESHCTSATIGIPVLHN